MPQRHLNCTPSLWERAEVKGDDLGKPLTPTLSPKAGEREREVIAPPSTCG
jgi:hypothetical protein